MRSVIVLLLGLWLCGFSASAQTYYGVGDEDLKWPDVPAIEEQPIPNTAGQRPQSPAPRRSEAANDDARNSSRSAPETQRTTRNLPIPPFPERRHIAVVIPEAAAGAETLAQTVPEELEHDDKLDVMIGQMLLVGFSGTSSEEEGPQAIASQIKAGLIGGVIFHGQNIKSGDQLRKLTSFFRKVNTPTPPFIAISQEGGAIQPLSSEKGFGEYASARQLGNSNDPFNAYTVYKEMADELAVNGFNLNIAPVADLDNEIAPADKRERSFGSHPKHVAAFAKAFSLAHQDEGILTAVKHFPGQGSTSKNPNEQPVDISESWKDKDLEPIRQLINSRAADMLFVGHAAHLLMSDEPDLPVSLSEKAIKTKLRKDLGFEGVIMSDDLEAPTVRRKLSLEDSAVQAIKAGNDMVLIGNQTAPSSDLPAKVLAAVKEAVATGGLDREQLERSYERILTLKQKLLSAEKPVASAKIGAKPNQRNP